MRPLWALRNLVLVGCSMVQSLPAEPRRSRRFAAGSASVAVTLSFVLGHRVVVHDLALEDPHLDPACAVRGERGCDAVIDVSAQRMQRHAALAVPLHARYLGSAEAPR